MLWCVCVARRDTVVIVGFVYEYIQQDGSRQGAASPRLNSLRTLGAVWLVLSLGSG